MVFIIFKDYVLIDFALTPEQEEWMNQTLVEKERNNLSTTFAKLLLTGHVITGQEASVSGNLHACYDHLQETDPHLTEKPLNQLHFGHLKHKQAYNLISFKTKGRRTRSSLSSPERQSNSQPD